MRSRDDEARSSEAHPGAGKLLSQRSGQRPRAAMTRGELQHRQHTALRWSWLGQELDVYL